MRAYSRREGAVLGSEAGAVVVDAPAAGAVDEPALENLSVQWTRSRGQRLTLVAELHRKQNAETGGQWRHHDGALARDSQRSSKNPQAVGDTE